MHEIWLRTLHHCCNEMKINDVSTHLREWSLISQTTLVPIPNIGLRTSKIKASVAIRSLKLQMISESQCNTLIARVFVRNTGLAARTSCRSILIEYESLYLQPRCIPLSAALFDIVLLWKTVTVQVWEEPQPLVEGKARHWVWLIWCRMRVRYGINWSLYGSVKSYICSPCGPSRLDCYISFPDGESPS